VNDESCKTGGLTREEVIGKNMVELERNGFVKESITLKTLKSGKMETMIQDLGDGGKVYATAQPRYENGTIRHVITTERDITETLLLKELLKERENENEKYEREIEYLKTRNIDMFGELVAVDPSSRLIANQAMRIAGLDTTVLLTGESGTGKEVFANLIYNNSERVGKPFIKVNCAAIPEHLLESEMFGYESGAFTGAEKKGRMGYFELANYGTLFLDEISEVPIHLQSKLLRVFQENEIMRVGGRKTIPLDIRLIVATNTDLKKAVDAGTFREDLYYRLNILPIEIPPLRHRKEDIEALAFYFAEKFSKQYKVKKTLSASAIERLKKYKWPGNIRELQNIIERSVISFDGEEITGFQIAILLYPGGNDEAVADRDVSENNLAKRLENYEEQIIREVYRTSKNASEAAKKLGLHKATMCRRMKKYNISI
jgi:transcriptional regulator with PAS, ATPase and Fis domain